MLDATKTKAISSTQYIGQLRVDFETYSDPLCCLALDHRVKHFCPILRVYWFSDDLMNPIMELIER